MIGLDVAPVAPMARLRGDLVGVDGVEPQLGAGGDQRLQRGHRRLRCETVIGIKMHADDADFSANEEDQNMPLVSLSIRVIRESRRCLAYQCAIGPPGTATWACVGVPLAPARAAGRPRRAGGRRSPRTRRRSTSITSRCCTSLRQPQRLACTTSRPCGTGRSPHRSPPFHSHEPAEVQPHELEPLAVGRPRPGVAGLDPVGRAAGRSTGSASAPRPMAMPWQPVSSIIRAASASDPHVAVAEDRDALDRLDHAADAVVVDAAAEALLAGAAVDGDRRDADLLELAGEERGRSGCRRPSRAASSP